MSGVLIWGWDKVNSAWVPIQVDANGKLELASLEDAEISQDTPEDLKHLPHGYYSGGPSYLPLAVDSAGKLQIDIAALEHLNDIGDVSLPSPTDGYAVYWDAGTSLYKCKAVLSNVVEDTTPQLGGNLDCQDKKLNSLLGLLFKTATEKTISSGAITVTQALHTVDTEGNAASDDLDTINGGSVVNMIVIKAANDARTVVVKHNTGNIWLQGKADISLDDLEDGLLLVWSGSKWFDIAAGGGAATPTKIQDADADTKVDTEESADEDIIRMDVAGVEAMKISDVGIVTYAKQSGAHCTRITTVQSIPSGATTKVELNSEDYDIQNEYDPSTNYRFTASEAGKYLVTFGFVLLSLNDGTRTKGYIYKNGAHVFSCDSYISAAGNLGPSGADVVEVAANDYIELYIYHDHGANRDLNAIYSAACFYKIA